MTTKGGASEGLNTASRIIPPPETSRWRACGDEVPKDAACNLNPPRNMTATLEIDFPPTMLLHAEDAAVAKPESPV